MRKILIVEDEVGVQMTLEDRFVEEGFDVTIKGDGIEGELEALKNIYDLIILDVMLPNRDGFMICENIRKQGVETPILMLTARNSDLDIVIGLRYGADDYLPKPFNMTVLLARVEALLRRMEKVSGKKTKKSVYTFGEFKLDFQKGELFRDEESVTLNAIEFRLLTYFITHEDSIITRDTLLDDVWGYETETTSRTVDVHIAKLRAKLGESDFHKHIQTIWGRGYKFIK